MHVAWIVTSVCKEIVVNFIVFITAFFEVLLSIFKCLSLSILFVLWQSKKTRECRCATSTRMLGEGHLRMLSSISLLYLIYSFQLLWIWLKCYFNGPNLDSLLKMLIVEYTCMGIKGLSPTLDRCKKCEWLT